MSAPLGLQLSMQQVNKQYGRKTVLQGVQLDISPGEFVAVVGRSGCGKSTLLRLISGLEPPTAGEISVDHERISGIHPDIRVMFQEARLLPWLKVVDNVAIGLGKEEKDKAVSALRRVGLETRARDWPGVLSGGQRQRVALARALASDPRMLLLDEPLGALDALTRIEMQQLIEEIWSIQKFTAMLVTHDVSEAIALADRVILIENGQIAFEVPVNLPRPRERDHHFIRLERLVLDRILKNHSNGVSSQLPYEAAPQLI
ncbi:ATP-binding cassette domain-containing protein [Alicyclobacillus acidoterrestris]|uniref:ATP-binding cassette domain-containing protein n=1 Tax=Alicyclobacillus acidoterrestris (strain ATCC 49025 / DSM 3922 / CIP 106132 / NCIMB 13137 / GD3B) TaxID=1356854 RepID=T0D7M2_ALIAG|nr:ATP-binding cassette domain-containing protein [Alicyclobacillus acidoterrestris]EPZ45726.1 hypothetical protein N007_08090 [Alicyclobacillus acidoterrestris ATCC 49025]UNO49999.1 ATP-binding cassette domain-containing protein [Alicyclobacillus acidoterrestris]